MPPAEETRSRGFQRRTFRSILHFSRSCIKDNGFNRKQHQIISEGQGPWHHRLKNMLSNLSLFPSQLRLFSDNLQQCWRCEICVLLPVYFILILKEQCTFGQQWFPQLFSPVKGVQTRVGVSQKLWTSISAGTFWEKMDHFMFQSHLRARQRQLLICVMHDTIFEGMVYTSRSKGSVGFELCPKNEWVRSLTKSPATVECRASRDTYGECEWRSVCVVDFWQNPWGVPFVPQLPWILGLPQRAFEFWTWCLETAILSDPKKQYSSGLHPFCGPLGQTLILVGNGFLFSTLFVWFGLTRLKKTSIGLHINNHGLRIRHASKVTWSRFLIQVCSGKYLNRA